MEDYSATKCVSRFRCITALLLTLAPPCFGQQSQPALQITSPADGTTVNSGQTISVTITSPANLTFTSIGILGPGGPLDANTSAPATFSLTIPAMIRPGRSSLTAVGKTSAGQAVFSRSVPITVERSDKPVSLTTNPPAYHFRQGEFDYLRVSGRFADGTTVDVTESTYLSFSSSNTAIVTVNAKGLVRAVAVGSATVKATYSSGPSRAVPVFVTAAPLSPSPTSLSFGTQNIGTASGPQAVTFTNNSNNSNLSVNGVGTSGDFSETDNCVSSSPLAVGATCTVNVAFAPTATGSRVGYLNVQTNMMANPIGIQLNGTGIESPSGPTIAGLSPTSGVVGSPVTISGTNFGTSQGTSTSLSSGTATTITNGDLIFGVGVEDTSGSRDSLMAGSGFTKRVDLGSLAAYADEDQVQASAGAIATTWTLSRSRSWIASLAAFKPKGGS